MDDRALIERQRARPAIVRLWQALRPLKSVVTFMSTGAHPDDETSDLLAALALRDGIRTIFVCSTRGEGGQNALGTETGHDLGALRTREMEVAAEALGLEVRWLSEGPDDPITDFGFSKNPDETFGKWGEERTIERLVRVIRQERPDIVCPTFLDVPGQHGHHRAMTRAARRAIELAADASFLPHLAAAGLPPWQVSKFYLPAWSGAGQSYDDDLPPPNATVVVDTGGRDSVLGATYAQVAQWSRAAHKSQGMGRWIDPGDDSRPLHVEWSSLGAARDETSVADGLPKGLANLDVGENTALRDTLRQVDAEIASALATWPDADAVGQAAARAMAALRQALPQAPAGIRHRLLLKETQLARVMFETSSLAVRAFGRPAIAAPGSSVEIVVHLDARDARLDGSARLSVAIPDGWVAEPAFLAGSGSFRIRVPADAPFSDGYPSGFSPNGGNGLVHLLASFSMKGMNATHRIDLGEPLAVAPAVDVGANPTAAVLNIARPVSPLRFRLSAQPVASDIERVAITPDVPAGWQCEPAQLQLDFTAGRSVGEFALSGEAAPGLHTFGFTADGKAALSVQRMDFPHSGRVVRSVPAAVHVRVMEASIPERVRIAYAGSGNDRVDYWLRQLGLEVAPLDAETIADGDLSAFDTILVGVFAFGMRPELAAAAARLHHFVRAGGNLVTLYHRPWDAWDPERIPPAFLRIGQPSLRWRVTDETAAVTVLEPDHPLLNRPNRIVADDWSGWHKERGLYFAAEWDPAYRPLLSMSDPGEPPLQGALLAADIGRGRHVHTSLVLHHQMERLVPGAFRLIANLVTPRETK
ncbi:MAG: PIG-L family deacetylase [Propylenella sp.]